MNPNEQGLQECTCKEWVENLPKVNAGFALMSVHGGTGYTGKVFEFCPWCSKSLRHPHREGKPCEHVWVWSNNAGMYLCSKCNEWSYLNKHFKQLCKDKAQPTPKGE
jgi:hypothetical protein